MTRNVVDKTHRIDTAVKTEDGAAMQIRSRLPLVMAAACAVEASLLTSDLAYAGDAGPPPGAVEMTITPFYGWVPGMTGNVGVLGTKVGLDITPLDITRNIGDLLPLVEGLYLGGGEIRHQHLGIMYDVLFMDVSLNQGIDGKLIKGSFGVDFRQTTATLAGTYRLIDVDGTHVDAVAGVRFWNIETSVQLDTNLLAANLDEGDRWVDPMIGIKGRTPLEDRWALSGWAMIGGFGAGSDFAWDVYGSLDYAWNDSMSLSLGLRALSADRVNGDFTWDMIQYGPMANAVFTF